MKVILVIEDESIIRENLLNILELHGFQGLGAADGVAGVEQAKAVLPDLIVCDILMPRMDGHAVLTALRQDAKTAAIPFIFLSAKVEHEDVRQGMNLGADDYLTKPFSSKDLIAAITARLQKQAALTQPYVRQIHQAVQALKQATYSDRLTRLPNRVLLCQTLKTALLNANLPIQTSGMIVIGMNRFSAINTKFGYAIGDNLLQCIAQRLCQAVGDCGTVGRLNGDQFGVVLHKLGGQAEAINWVQTLLTTITAPYMLQGRELRLQACAGIALALNNQQNHPETLLAQADSARRWCHQQGQSYRFYDAAIDATETHRQFIETHLTGALGRSEFQVYYQPQVNLKSGRMVGVEALLRWHHPKQGMICPTAFIPVAEAMGVILPLGEWVLETSCTQAKAWQQEYSVPLRVAVNLSMRQFQQQDLVQTVTRILVQTGLDPRLLTLELTETCLMDDVKSTIDMLQQLKQTGIEISIDDFGTGYSSLNYLSNLPVDALKIDRSFINQVAVDAHAAAIATAIISMAKNLRLKVVAEGVENYQQLAFLQKTSCHALQGYLFSPAVPAAAIQALLAQGKRLELARV
jgi:diguanylate cyclase